MKEELYKVESKLFEIAKQGDISKIKGHISDVYDYSRVSDKIVYKKLLKAAIKIIPDKIENKFLLNILTDKIDNNWSKPINFEDLINELIKIIQES